MKSVIFGIGSGRCGTQSLSVLLNSQEESRFTHEVSTNEIPWQRDVARFNKTLNEVKSRPEKFVGDVAFYHLQYSKEIFASDGKIIILKRRRQETIESFLSKSPKANHWFEGLESPWLLSGWDKCFPKFATTNRREAIGLYYDHYYDLCNQLDQNKCFWIKTEDLNNEPRVLEMLTWCGFENPRFIKFHKNKT